MDYPAHVQRLLDSLTDEQRAYQLRCFEQLRAIRIFVGFVLAMASGAGLWGYFAGHSFAQRVFEVYRTHAGSFAEYSFPLLCALALVLGIYMLTQRGH